jgi:hypothetical protein
MSYSKSITYAQTAPKGSHLRKSLGFNDLQMRPLWLGWESLLLK